MKTDKNTGETIEQTTKELGKIMIDSCVVALCNKKEIEQLREAEEINPKIFLFADDNVEEGQVIIIGDSELKKRMIEEIERIWTAHGQGLGGNEGQ